MNAAELLTTLHSAGAVVSIDGDDLLITATRGALSPDLRATLAKAKPVLLAELKKQTAYGTDNIDTIDRNQPDADMLKDHLAILYRDIRDGCRLGLHQHLARVPAEIVRSIIAAAGPDTDEATFHALCQQAGEATLLAAAIDEYRYRLHVLSEMGEDTMRYAAALELCLCHPTKAGAP